MPTRASRARSSIACRWNAIRTRCSKAIILSCYATRATTAYIYLRYEYPLCLQADAGGHRRVPTPPATWARTSSAADFSLDIYIHRGAAAYVCGEETGLIESLEGKRAWPRIKPPFPAVEGLFRKPTVVNNVETVACVKHIVERGVAWFKSIGTPPDPNDPRDPGSFGPKLYGLSGHVNRPGCYEAPLGITVRQLIEEYGGGVWKGRKAKAVIPGGLSTGVMTAAEFDTPLDFSAPLKVGCLGLGTACVVVLDETYSMVDFLHNSCRFFAHESCGQCTPCREGTHWALKMIERIKAGRGRLEGPRLAAGDRRFDRHHARHHDLRPGRRRRLADQERHPQVPRRVRGVHQADESEGYMETEPVEAIQCGVQSTEYR